MESDDILEMIQQIETTSEEILTIENRDKLFELSKNLEKCLTDLIYKLVKQIDSAEKEFLTEVIDLLLMLNNKYKFDQILKSGIKCTLLISYVNALVYQKDWKFDKLSECLTIMENVFSEHLNIDERESIFVIESKSFPKTDQIFGLEVLTKIRLAICLCESFLQHTAVYSQLGQHDQALKSCERCFDILMFIIKHISEIFSVIKRVGSENMKHIGSFTNDINDLDIYIEFLKNIKIPKMSLNEPWSNSIPNWKINKENTLKYIYQKIDLQRQTAGLKVLSKKIEKEWIDNFHISNIVKLQPFESFLSKMDPGLFDENLILQVILALACCIFSIAAENRFISYKEIQSKSASQAPGSEATISIKQDKEKKNPKIMEDMSKDLKLQKEQRFILSEKVHLKTLEILTFGLKDSIKLLNHCFQSYKKNYDFNILMIEEVDEPSFSTIRNSEYFFNGADESHNLEEIDKLNQKIKQLVKNDNQKRADEEIYGDSDDQSKMRNSHDKVKTGYSIKQNAFSSLYGLNNRVFSKTKTNILNPTSGRDLEVDDKREKCINVSPINDKREKQGIKNNITVLKSVASDLKFTEFLKYKQDREEITDVVNKDKTSVPNIQHKTEFFRPFRLEKNFEAPKFDIGILNSIKNKPKSLSTTYKSNTQREFMRTMENNQIKSGEKQDFEKSEARLSKPIKKELFRDSSTNQIDGSISARNVKAISIGKELMQKKTEKSPISRIFTEQKNEVKVKTGAAVSPKHSISRFSYLISQMNQNSKNGLKSDRIEYDFTRGNVRQLNTNTLQSDFTKNKINKT